ncbi:hypothetical protein KAJ61_03130 [Candidatus Parcubacteria bacterium]|nr:hypothetical protein [Candidatus Parcubacteria bacterium]
MKIYSLKSGLNLAELNSEHECAIEGIIGQDNTPRINGEIVDNDFYISDLSLLKGGQILSLIDNNKHHILNRIKRGGVLLCFAEKIQKCNEKTNYTWIYDFSNHFNIENLEGNDFNFCGNEDFINDFQKIVNDFKFFCIFNSNKRNELNNIFKKIGINKGGNGVAVFAKFGRGYIFILPKPNDKNKIIKYFIEKIFPKLEVNFEIESGSKEPIPEEIKNLEVTEQKELKGKIEKQNEVIKNEKEKLGNLNKEYKKLEQWKDLLWQTGTPLENIVKNFFNLLGLKLEKQEIDLVGKYNDCEVFIEVKGNTKCIDHKNDFRQIQERKHYNSKDPQNTIALLVGDAFRLESLDQRPPSENHSIFAETSVSIAKDTKIGLISTIELFNVINDILNKKKQIDKNKILEKILNCHGIYSYKS